MFPALAKKVWSNRDPLLFLLFLGSVVNFWINWHPSSDWVKYQSHHEDHEYRQVDMTPPEQVDHVGHIYRYARWSSGKGYVTKEDDEMSNFFLGIKGVAYGFIVWEVGLVALCFIGVGALSTRNDQLRTHN